MAVAVANELKPGKSHSNEPTYKSGVYKQSLNT
jgi:hypothetical protein